MKNININKLLEKYWNAETDLNEEATLSKYFAGDEIAPEHEQYKPLFQIYNMASGIKYEKPIEIPKETPVIGIRRWANWNVIGIAASFLILITIGVYNFGTNSNLDSTSYLMESIAVTEEDEALEVTMDALAYLGVKWDNSSQIIQNNVSKMETVSIIK
jgi:hypothetical protein